MGLFRGSKTYTPQDLGLPTVESLAAEMLQRAGLEQSEIARVAQLYPTETPPNPDRSISAGSPPNPWTLSCLAAEQILWDTLNGYATGQGLTKPATATAAYQAEGLNGLATIIMKGRRGSFEQEVAKQVMEGYIQRTFDRPDHAMWSLVSGYVQDYWTPGVGPRESP